MALTGTRRVRIFRPAFDEVRKLCRHTKACIEIRRHALKLRYWPNNYPEDDEGQLIDLDWSWIKAMPGMRTGELRIDDEISGHRNLRIIFYVGDDEVKEPLPMIWVLTVFAKKRNDFTDAQIAVFKGRRKLVRERFYERRL